MEYEVNANLHHTFQSKWCSWQPDAYLPRFPSSDGWFPQPCIYLKTHVAPRLGWQLMGEKHTFLENELYLWHQACVLSHFSPVSFFVTPWTVAHQAPLSMGFSRQEYWSGLPFPSPGDLPDPGIKPTSPALAGGFFTAEQPGNCDLASITDLC